MAMSAAAPYAFQLGYQGASMAHNYARKHQLYRRGAQYAAGKIQAAWRGRKKRTRFVAPSYSSNKRRKVFTRNRGSLPRSISLGLGIAPKAQGTLKSHVCINNVDCAIAKLRIGQIHLCDMNNDQRTAQGNADNEGISHWGTSQAPTIQRYPTPYYFDTIKSLYENYLIKGFMTRITFFYRDVTADDDVCIAYKIFNPDDDDDDVVRNSADAELIMSQDGVRKIYLTPTNAARTGGQRKTITIKVNPTKLITKRKYYAESTAIGVGEKDFDDTAAIINGSANGAPRIVFWAWKARSCNILDATTLSVEQTCYYRYVAYNRKAPAIS